MYTRSVPFVLVPPSPFSPRKRKPSRSPPPARSSPSSSPNPSPKKRARAAEDVDLTTSRLSQFALDTPRGSGSRQLSPTVSDMVLDEDEAETRRSALEDEESAVIFEYDADADYVKEAELHAKLGETPGSGTPIRRLVDFTLFVRKNLQLVDPFGFLDDGLPSDVYGASGVVKGVDEDSDDESDDEDGDENGHRVKLLKIIEFNLHDFDKSQEHLDENIYIKTADAWYILDAASSIYQPLWNRISVLHGLAHSVILKAFDNPRATYADFDELESDEVISYVTQAVDRVVDQGAPISRVPLIRQLLGPILPSSASSPLSFGSSASYGGSVSSSASSSGGSSVSASASSSIGRPVKRAGPRKALEKDATTYLTPIVDRIVTKYLLSPVAVLGAELDRIEKEVATDLKKAREHKEDPEHVFWGERLDNSRGYYSSVTIDGETYSIGDVVAVAPGTDSNVEREASEAFAVTHCVNAFANKFWFVQIKYFFEEDGQHMFHGQWFVHGSRTLLQEVTHSQELFLLPECDDIAVATIFQECEAKLLEPDKVEEPDSCEAKARNYFYRLGYDDKAHHFTDLPSGDEGDRLSRLFPEHQYCMCCARKAEEELSNTVQVIGDEDDGYGLVQYNNTYHQDDFVYVRPAVEKNEELVLFIAQITHVDEQNQLLRVRYYERYEGDERRLYRTRRTNFVAVGDLDSVCYVRYLDPALPAARAEADSWVNAHTDHFYMSEKDTADGRVTMSIEDFEWCSKCFDSHCEELEEHARFVRSKGTVSVCEVFAGAGGLCQGLDRSGFFDHKWAIERWGTAALTLRANHPELTVLPVDINDLIRYAVVRDRGENPPPLKDANGNAYPDKLIPKPKDFGLLCGGPPCQSFSGANSNKTEDDPRSALPFAMLAVAEHFEPEYVILENVLGLLQHSVSHPANDGRRIEKAMLKLICRVLIALGYQAKARVMEAGQYGAPQTRRRVIFWGAKRGLKMPQSPVPTHACKSAGKQKLFLKSDFLPPARRGREEGDDHIFAPHAGVTIQDAIGDLPPFDWINPHQIEKETAAHIAEVQARVAQGIQQFDTSDAPVGFRDPVEYATAPTTHYQKAMRRKNPKRVANHFTDRSSSTVAETSTQIPLTPLANHRDLPSKYFEGIKLNVKSIPCYGRLDANGRFRTAMTTVTPRSRASCVLHPTQKRAISVVEAKRAQGFPDDYVLMSEKTSPSDRVKEFYKQIGNAVPVPLAAALGHSLESSIVATWKRHPRQASPEA